MKELLDKISSYNLFNYLLPGVIYVILLREFTGVDLLLDSFLAGAFFYYFLGLIISRIGSLIIEPTLIKWKVVKFSSYEDFIKASGEDDKINLFSEVNNTYRTLISLGFFLLMTLIYVEFIIPLGINEDVTTFLICLGILILFILSYRKQTNYINKRIKKSVKND